MAGSLIKIDEEIVTSAVASVTLGGANWDSVNGTTNWADHIAQVKADNPKPE